MRKLTEYSEKDNTLYIYSRILLPNTTGMTFKDHCRAYKEAFAMSYEDRLKKYASKEDQAIVQKEIDAHPGCDISEFDSVGL